MLNSGPSRTQATWPRTRDLRLLLPGPGPLLLQGTAPCAGSGESEALGRKGSDRVTRGGCRGLGRGPVASDAALTVPARCAQGVEFSPKSPERRSCSLSRQKPGAGQEQARDEMKESSSPLTVELNKTATAATHASHLKHPPSFRSDLEIPAQEPTGGEG